MDLHEGWKKHPKGNIPRGTICPTCFRYNSRDIVCTALVVRNGKVLMVKRGGYPMIGYWGLIGGYLGWDELPQEGVVRELKEETGLKGKNPRLFGVYGGTKRDKDGRQNVGILYLVDAVGRGKALDEVKEVKWFDLTDLPEKIAFDHRRMIEDYKEKVRKVRKVWRV